MLATALGRVDPALIGLDAHTLPCPRCGLRCVRTFDMGDDVWGCRRCARPAPETQIARFYEETKHAHV